MILTGKLRMIQWLAFTALLYVVAIGLRVLDQHGALDPALLPMQTAAWKLGNVTLAAYVGFFIDRAAFAPLGLLDPTSPALAMIRRAIIMGSAMVAVALGL